VDLFDHRFEVLVQSLVDNHFLSKVDCYHFANALVPLLVAVLVMPLFSNVDLKSVRNFFLS
jgi:hypothetical protein